ncbi:MAG: hypothetical protein KY439_02585 [Actinobacteria bacterium]|nr:hypothetical protein [Actinomycetota bacterium]
MKPGTEDRLRNLAAELDQAASPVTLAEVTRRSRSKEGSSTRWRTVALGAAAAAAAVVAVVVALAGGDTATLRTGPPAGDQGGGPALPQPPDAPAFPTSPGPAGPVSARVPVAGPALAEVGIGVLDGDQMVLLDPSGAEVGRAPVGNFYLRTPGRPVPVTVAGATAVLVPDELPPPPAPAPFADDCIDAHESGATVVARCGAAPTPNRIDVATGRRAPRTLTGSPAGPPPPGQPEIGHWSTVRLSPDGSMLLAEWSAECEVPTAFLIDTSTGAWRTVTGEKGTEWPQAPTSTVAGWLPDGRPVVALRAGACGTADATPGVYTTSSAPGSSKPDLRVLYRSSDPAPTAFIWRRTDDPRWAPPLQSSAPGTVPIEAINRFLHEHRPPWAASPERAAAALLGDLDRGEGATRSTETTRRGAEVVVTVIDEGLPDDSLRSQRYRFTFTPRVRRGSLQLVSADIDWRCREGRGHQEFSTEPCL